MENLDTATKEEDPQKQFEALSTNFSILLGMYSTSHDPKVREMAEDLRDFIRSYFPNRYNEEQFSVKCLDGFCGKIAYSTQEDEIISLANEITFKDQRTKDDFMRNLEAANLTSNEEGKWRYYDSAFRIVQAEIKEAKNSDSRLRDLAEKIEGLIKASNPEVYEHNSGIGLYNIE